MEPLVSISGVRGIVGNSFTEELVRRWATAFAQHCHPEQREGSRDYSASPQNDGRIVLGRDTRPSGEGALQCAAEEVARAGTQPIVIGIAPTPTVQLAVTHHRAVGGIIITASHNPAEWNGLKFLGPDGVFLSAEEIRTVEQRVGAALRGRPDGGRAQRPSPTEHRVDESAIARHIENILSLPIDAERIRTRKFRVVLDPVNGTGALAIPPLLAQLGCTVTMINGEPNGQFVHPPEPTPTNLTELGRCAGAERADLGIAVDPDADRLVLVDGTGTVLSEEYTITLAVLSALSSNVILSGAKNLARRDPSPSVQDDTTVVANLSTTRMVDDVARKFGATVVRTPVGERHVVEGMRQHGALIGGEGNGGVIFPHSHEGRDALVGIALILDLLTRRETTLAQLTSELPRYVMTKEKLPLGDSHQLPKLTEKLRQLAAATPGVTLSILDGIRMDTPDGWVHLRPSNTEPVIRLIAEASSSPRIARLQAIVREAVSTRA